MAVALLALFVALGGVSYGVAASSIGTRAIKDGSVQSRDIRDAGVQGRDVMNGTLLSRDVRDGTLIGSDVRNGGLRGADVRDGSLGGVDLADGSIAGRDVARNALGDREINEPDLDIQRLGGFDASRYVRNVKQIQTATANDPTTPKAAPPARCPKAKPCSAAGHT